MEVDRKCFLELDSVSVSEVLGSSGVRVMSPKNCIRTDLCVKNNS